MDKIEPVNLYQEFRRLGLSSTKATEAREIVQRHVSDVVCAMQEQVSDLLSENARLREALEACLNRAAIAKARGGA